MSSVSTSTIVFATVGTVATGALAYAVYFDYRRRHDVEFRKSLKRESKRLAKAAKVEEEQSGLKRRHQARRLVDESNEEGYPQGMEENEAFFMAQVSEGEQLSQDSTREIEAALCFFKAMKVYPQPKELMGIYDKTVPKPVLDILAEMVAYDRTSDAGSATSSAAGVE